MHLAVVEGICERGEVGMVRPYIGCFLKAAEEVRNT